MRLLALQRFIRRLALGNLARSMRAWLRRYAKSYYSFNVDEVICMVQRRPGRLETFEALAGAYSNDPLLIGVASHGVYWFYRDGPYESKAEANASLLLSVVRAARVHSETQFLLASNVVLSEFQVFRGGSWQSTAGTPILRRCPGCSNFVQEGVVICSNCGEPVGT
jgi:hypothetical protein